MSFALTSMDYANYLKKAAAKIDENKNYISDLDAATGDGDHWTNMKLGFDKLIESYDELAAMNVSDMYKKMGMIMMSSIGGSSGALYGSAYISAAKALKGNETIDLNGLLLVFDAMSNAIMERGQCKPGFKTMLDALYPAVEVMKKGIADGIDEKEILTMAKKASLDGVQSTKDMEAVKGRACYQANKGVGHIDPGAVTMSYQIEVLVDYILEM